MVIGGTAPFWCEFPVVFDSVERMEHVLRALKEQGIHGGVRLGPMTRKASDASTIVVAVTEKRTKKELDAYISIVREVLA